MKNVLFTLVLIFGLSTIGISGKLPIEYQVQKNYHRMKLVLNGDIQWNVSQSGNTFDITLMGNESHFIIKNINYNFRDGVIKKFNYRTTLEGTKKIIVELRTSVNDYHIYQDETTKNLYIEFYPAKISGAVIARTVPDKKSSVSTKKQAELSSPKQNVVNIPQIVLEQVEQQPVKVAAEENRFTPTGKSGTSSSAAIWLFLVSVSILLTGGGFTVYAFLRRRASQSRQAANSKAVPAGVSEFKAILERQAEPVDLPRTVPGIVIPDEDENSFSHSIEFAEQYLRSQGELELQQRLENMSARSTQQKIGVAIPAAKKKDPAILAQKLGLSVGELELVTRLQQFHKQHSSEVS